MLGRVFGILFCVVVVFVFPLAAEASAVEGCRYEAEVLDVTTDTSGENPEITLKLKVKTAENFGHSAGIALCSEAGAEITFPVDNDGDVLKDKLAQGDRIMVEDATVYNMTAEGARRFHNQRYGGRVPTPAPEAPKSP